LQEGLRKNNSCI